MSITAVPRPRARKPTAFASASIVLSWTSSTELRSARRSIWRSRSCRTISTSGSSTTMSSAPIRAAGASVRPRCRPSLTQSHWRRRNSWPLDHRRQLHWLNQPTASVRPTLDYYIYAKRPFAGPKTVRAYVSRYTHRVAISNRRLIALYERSVTFKVKDYRIEGPGRYTTMTLGVGEFIRRFLSHVLPKGFHRIRHYGLFASTNRTETMEGVRKLFNLAPPAAGPQQEPDVAPDTPRVLPYPCACCGARMIVIEVFARGCQPSWRPAPSRIDSS